MLLTSILKNSAEKYKNKPALTMKMGFRTKTLSYKDVLELSKRIAVLLKKNGVKKGDKVIICAPNSPYWICVYWATLLLGAIAVPLSVQSQQEFILKIIKETEAKVFFKHLFFKFELPKETKQFEIDLIEEYVEDIDISEFKETELSEDDLMLLMYTSGTTGDPKGVMLTHKNIYSNLKTISKIIIVDLEKDTILSVLPLSHIFEQTMGFLLPFWRGVHIVYTHSYAAIRSLMKKYKISKFVAVPEFLQILMTRIESEAETKGRKRIFDKLMKFSLKINNQFISRILFCSVLRQLGGKIDTIASGGAALDSKLEKKWIAIGVDILQGYGLTETSPVVTTNTYQESKIGSVGKVIEGVEVKIAQDKEILVKGPNVFIGYFKDEKKTKEAFTDDGWFKTGDLGEFDQDGFLYIKGRKKYMILGPGGKNVYPEDIEFELNKIEGVKDSCVLGLEKETGAVEIHAVLLLDQEKNISVEEVVQRANKNLASYQNIMGWTVWPDIDFPRTVTRKIKKEDVRKYLEGKKEEGAQVSEQKRSKIVQILSQVTGVDVNKITDSTKIVPDLNLDSLMRIELVAWIEEDLGIMIEETAITPTTTVIELEDLVKEKKPIKELPKLKKWPRSKWIIPFRIILQYFFFILIKLFVKLKVEGKENLKNLQLPVIFMPNHISYLDSLIIAQSIPFRIRLNSSFAAARDVLYETYKFWAFIVETGFNSFPIQRREDEPIRYGLDFIGQMLDWGYSVVMFPEGRMSETGKLQDLRRGAGLVATEMDVYIVPMKIQGTSDIVPYGELFPKKRGKVIVKFGKPLKFKRSDSYSEALEKIDKAMREL